MSVTDSLLQQSALQYWKAKLGNAVNFEAADVFFLPGKPERLTDGKHTVTTLLQGSIATQIKSLTKSSPVLEYAFYLAAYDILLHRYFGEDEIIVGSSTLAVSGVPESLVFYKCAISSDETFKSVYTRCKEDILEVANYWMSSSDFESLTALRRCSQAALSVEDCTTDNASLDTFSLHLKVLSGTSPRVVLEADGHYAPELLDRFLENYVHLLAGICKNPLESVIKLDCPNAVERTELQRNFRGTQLSSEFVSVVEAFRNQAQANGKNSFVISGAGRVSLAEVDSFSDALARMLIKDLGIKKGDVVGVMTSHSIEMVVAVLAILKTGACFLPLEVSYPAERLNYIIENSHAQWVLVDDTGKQSAGALRAKVFLIDPEAAVSVLDVDQVQAQINPHDIAYIIYTSGSTGSPKGVAVEHGSLANYIQWANAYYFPRGAGHFALFTPLSFDLTITSLFCPLTLGASIHTFSGPVETVLEQVFSEASGIWTVKLTPSHISVLRHLGLTSTAAEIVIVGGEILRDDHVATLRSLNPHIKVYNEYGPTEATVGCIATPVDHVPDLSVIGRPITGTAIHITDKDNSLLPVGAWGEICIEGSCLARGYLNQAELTQLRFPANAGFSRGRIYRTGDVGRWLPNGEIQYRGRNDRQVKCRGYRIELEEIEQRVTMYDGISNAFVCIGKTLSADQIICYYTANTEVPALRIRAFLQNFLPAYMMPDHFIALEKFPLTSNGKLDVASLPPVDTFAGFGDSTQASPSNHVQMLLTDIWRQVLGRKTIRIDDNFFHLGGQSIKAIQLIHSIYKRFQVKTDVRTIFENPTIQAQSDIILSSGFSAFEGIQVIEEQDHYRASHGQRRQWVISNFEAAEVAYNIPIVHRLRNLNKDAFTEAFQILVQRHESLRTYFTEIDGDIRQVVRQEILPSSYLEVTDLSAAINATDDARGAVMNDIIRRFDLGCAPLFRVRLIRINKSDYYFALTIHHIISDAWSLEVMVNEILSYYNALSDDRPAVFEPLTLQYKDYSFWQHRQLAGGAFASHRAYWLDQFSGVIPVLQLNTDFPRPAIKTYAGRRQMMPLGMALTKKLNDYSKMHGVTLFITLLTGVEALLHRYTGQEDIVIGTPVAGREHADLEKQIGFYVNTLAIRTRFHKRDRFADLLEKVKKASIDGYIHQMYPFDYLVTELGLERDLSRSPLFDVMVVMQNVLLGDRDQRSVLAGVQVDEADQDIQASKFDLEFTFTDTKSGVRLSITYNPDLFTEQRIQWMLLHYGRLIDHALDHPTLSIAEIVYVTEAETALIEKWNSTDAPCPYDNVIQQLFEYQVSIKPHRIALVFEDRLFTFSHVNREANKVAHFLSSRAHIGPGSLVGVLLDRSEFMIIAILGVIKAGGAYVAIEPAFPAERKQYILDDAAVKVLITDQSLDELDIQGVSVLNCGEDLSNFPDSNPPVRTTITDPLYVLYTSGSTGGPKGVMIEQAGIVNRIEWMWNELGYNKDDIFFQKTPFVFDVSVWEIFIPACYGVTSILCRKEVIYDPSRIIDHIARYRITGLHFVPSMLSAFLESFRQSDQRSIRYLKRVIASGEALNPELNRMYSQKIVAPLYNLYGPTEASVDVSFFQTNADSVSVPIGRPISNIRILVLDDSLRMVPIGAVGEICISGIGLARGYVNKPEQTNERFCQAADGTRVYRTGDTGYWSAEGHVHYLGRKDEQIKIRGNRVELGEIESAARSFTGVTQCAVSFVAPGSPDARLVMFYAGSTIDENELQRFLRKRLPEYMVPQQYVVLDHIPLTHNGKLDRKALAIAAEKSRQTIPVTVARNSVELTLANIWRSVLKQELIDIHADFFRIGGNSITAILAINRMRKSFGIDLSLSEFYEASSISALTETIRQKTPHAATAIIPPAAEQNSYALSFTQRRFWFIHQLETDQTAYNTPVALKVAGPLDVQCLKHAFNVLIDRHEILRTVFEFVDNEPRQVVTTREQLGFEVQLKDLSRIADAKAEARKLALKESRFRFDLHRGPLLRVMIVRLAQDSYVVLLTMHHIVVDGWSFGIITQELMHLYQSLKRGSPVSLPGLDIQYKDFAAWQTGAANARRMSAEKNYWVNKFQGDVPILDFSTLTRPVYKTYTSASSRFTLDGKVSRAVGDFSKEHSTTRFSVLTAVLKILISRYTQQNDIVLGTVVAGRNHIQLENQIGLFLNTLALRTAIDPGRSFIDMVAAVSQTIREAHAHQMYPFEQLVEDLNIRRDMSRSPLFDFLVVSDDVQPSDRQLTADGLSFQQFETDFSANKYDITFYFNSSDQDSLRLEFAYNTDVYQQSEIARMQTHFVNLLVALLNAPHQPVHTLSFLSKDETRFLLEEFNDTIAPYTTDSLMHELFERQAATQPDSIALQFYHTNITYGVLNEDANRLARHLIEVGVKKGDSVGILFNRGIDMVTSMLAVLKAGACYVPVDPNYPANRQQFILDNAEVQVVITDAHYPHDGSRTVVLYNREAMLQLSGSNTNIRVSPTELAYVIYTSGSTGRPKGVMIEHHSAVNLIQWVNRQFEVNAQDKLLFVTSVCFDLSVYDIFGMLGAGGSIVITTHDQVQDPAIMLNLLKYCKVTFWDSVPSTLNTSVGYAEASYRNYSQKDLRVVFMSGDWIPVKLPGQIKKYFPNANVNSLGGATEGTVWSNWFEIKNVDSRWVRIPYGKPISNNFFYVLDDFHNPAPIGVKGELYIGGVGVARGYKNDPDRSSVAFVDDPFSKSLGGRMYKTGDIGRIMEDGNMEILGRKDNQLKIRGYRVETGEIEHVLSLNEGISACVVAPHDAGGSKLLVAYYVAKAPLETTLLRKYLLEHLPEYMVPSFFVSIEKIPLNSNGKVDRKALPDPLTITKEDQQVPQTAIECKIAEIWKEFLGVQFVAVNDNFFDIGGHSLNATQVLAKIFDQYGLRIELRKFFTNSTIQFLAGEIERHQWLQQNEMHTSESGKELII